MLNYDGGRYSLDCWVDSENPGPADENEVSDDADALRARVAPLLRAGRFKYLILYERGGDGWIEIEHFDESYLEDSQ